MPRKIRDESDAITCLNAVEASGLARADWAQQQTSMSWSAPSSLDVAILVLQAMVTEDLARATTSSPAPP